MPSLELPADRRRPRRPSFRGGARELPVPGDLPGRLRAFCRREGVTSYMALLASFQTLLLRYSGQTEYSGVDYLLAYWLARAAGSIAADD